jgi:hypothetical protein
VPKEYTHTQLADPIHFRVPDHWRGRVKSRQVRKWFNELEEGQVSLASHDPGPGRLELSIRIPRLALKQAARRLGISGTTLLRRLIAPHVEPRYHQPARVAQLPISRPSVPVPALPSSFSRATRPTASPTVARQRVSASGQIQAGSEAQLRQPLILPTVDGLRSLEEIGHAMHEGTGITGEEFIRWKAVHSRK